MLGTALFYCDALITPAISVLSAVEGLELLNPDFATAVLPVTLVVIVMLFAIQRRGTERVGRLFGPDHDPLVRRRSRCSASWTSCERPQVLAGRESAGTASVCSAAHPGLSARDPRRRDSRGDRLRSAVCRHGAFRAQARRDGLAGAGLARAAASTISVRARCCCSRRRRSPILSMRSRRRARCRCWCCCPPRPRSSLRRRSISGAFSVTREAVQLDLLPRVRVLQTSAEAQGQIYVPAANFHVRRGDPVRPRLRQLERAVGRLRRVGGRHHAHHHAC